MNEAQRAPLATYDAATARLCAYMAYTGISPKRLAIAAGLSPRVMLHMRERWNPTLDTLKKLEAVLPADFDPEKIRHEYLDGIERVRAWVLETKQPRSHLVPQGIQYHWVQNMLEPNWAPTWFALRKLLALIPPDFTHQQQERYDGTRTTADAAS